VMGIGGRELRTDAHASTHMAGHSILKNRVRVKLKDWGEGALLGVRAGMQVSGFWQNGFQLRATVVFGHKEPHPHIVCGGR
jgi:hypothetical protein